MTGPAFDRVTEALTTAGRKVAHDKPGQVMAQCPAHDDKNPSLSVAAGSGGVLLYCFAGCSTADVVAALGLTSADLFDDPRGCTYRYDDGRTVYRAPEKRFRQSGATKGRATLYRLAEVAQAIATGRPVYLVEGEKDADNLRELAGVTATTAPQGAKNFHLVDVEPLRGAVVVAVVDRDEPGDAWAAAVAEKLDGVAVAVVWRRSRVGKDASDHLAAGYGVHELDEYRAPAGPPPAAGGRRLRLTWAANIEPLPVVWAWEPPEGGRIPSGALTVAAGREGTGKSSFGIWLAAHVTRGTLPGAFYGKPRPVFYVAAEDSWEHTLIPRLIAAGADLTMVARLDAVTDDDADVPLSLPADVVALELAVLEHRAALVVLDPLMSVIGAKIDTHRERETRLALDPLARLADRAGCVLLGIAHFNKGAGSDAASLITGSGAFKNVPRAVFGFARDEADESGGRVMTQVKNSLGLDGLPNLAYRIAGVDVPTKAGLANTGRFTFMGESDKSVADLLKAARRDEGSDDAATSEVGEWLRDFLTSQGGECARKHIAKAARAEGYADRTLDRAREKIGVTSSRSGFPSTTVWALTVPPTPFGGTVERHLLGGTGGTGLTRGDTPSNVVNFPSPANSPAVGATGAKRGQTAPATMPTCEGCGSSMVALGDGATTHPGCEARP